MSEYITTILLFLAELGYFGIALALMIEVIPSEIVLAYAGFLVSTGKVSFVGAIVAGTIGGVIAQVFLYWLGRYGGRPFLLKYGKYILITEKQINLSEQWFNKYGIGVIFTARFIPVVRHAISIPAGITKMPLSKFVLYTTAAVIPWSIFFVFLGEKLGQNWDHINEKAAPYVQPIAIGAVVIIALYLIIKWFFAKKRV